MYFGTIQALDRVESVTSFCSDLDGQLDRDVGGAVAEPDDQDPLAAAGPAGPSGRCSGGSGSTRR